MNAIASFRLCTLNDEELLGKIDKACDEIFIKQKVPIRHIPARPDSDFDLLVGELLLRYKHNKDTAIGFSDWQKELVFTDKDIWLKEKTIKELYDLYLETL